MTSLNVCVFCASARKAPAKWMDIAARVGGGLASMDAHVVYGGASIGLMGAVADAALAGGSRVTGVIPRWLMLKEVVHEGLDELIVTENMHERKMRMYEMADVFLILPGGIGTLEEALEVITWRQLGIHIKPVFLLNAGGFYDNLLAQFEICVDQGLMKRETLSLWKTKNDEKDLFHALKSLNIQA